MKNIINRIDKIEAVLLKGDDTDEILSSMSTEQRHRRIAELSYKNGSYNGYVFKSLEEYDSMTFTDQSRYIAEVVEVMKPWVEEKRGGTKQ